MNKTCGASSAEKTDNVEDNLTLLPVIQYENVDRH